jgi:hypothetical protein
MHWFIRWLGSATADWTLLDWLGALGAIATIAALAGGVLYWMIGRIVGHVLRRRAARRQERDRVRALLTFLWAHRVLDSPLYQEDPRGSLNSVREIRVRLRQDLEALPLESEALRPIREMHEACIGFLNRIEPLPMPAESEPLPPEWLDGVYWGKLGNALGLMRQVFDPCMNQLYEAYNLDKPPPRVVVSYIEPLFMPGGPVSYPLPRYPKDIVKVSLRVLRTFYDLSDGNPTNLVLRKDAAIKAWLTTDQFDTVVCLLIVAGFVVIDGAARSEAYRITPEGLRKVERYQLIAQGLDPDTGKPLQE